MISNVGTSYVNRLGINEQTSIFNSAQKNNNLDEALKIAFSDATPRQKKQMFNNLMLKKRAKSLEAQFKQLSENQKNIKKAEEEKRNLENKNTTNHDGDTASISKEAVQQFEKSSLVNLSRTEIVVSSEPVTPSETTPVS
ncbi:hypothetical protein D3C74_232490 [compost metagenome]